MFSDVGGKNRMIKRLTAMLVILSMLMITGIGYGATAPVTIYGRPEEENLTTGYRYEPVSVQQVDGRQGIAWENGAYWVSGSTTLSCYDASWKLIRTNESPFENIQNSVNHIGDIDVYQGEVYAGVEYFMDGNASNIQIVVYDAETLEYRRSYPFDAASGQTEVSGIAVDPDHRIIWLCSWGDGETGRYLYQYDLADGHYLGKTHLQCPPQWIQGIAYYDGYLYLTADDGTADLGEADHLYRCRVNPEKTNMTVVLERTFDDVTLQGEIEGVSFDRDNGHLLISYNRGAQVVLGMPLGFYDGYDQEIHEIFVYSMEGKTMIDYMTLVNKEYPLPEGWEETVELVHMTNSLGDDVAVERKAYEAYLRLREALAAEGIDVDLDSAYRSVAEQQDIVKRFTEKYGEDYVRKYVAVPGYSEHHTGLALDLYLIIDGKDVYLNEDMVQYPEIWAKIHNRLAEHGFILRYPEGKEAITGYSYEPWHIRYIDDSDKAGEIMAAGMTLEEYPGRVNFSASINALENRT